MGIDRRAFLKGLVGLSAGAVVAFTANKSENTGDVVSINTPSSFESSPLKVPIDLHRNDDTTSLSFTPILTDAHWGNTLKHSPLFLSTTADLSYASTASFQIYRGT